MERVAITGFGVVSPVGSGRDRFFDSLTRGKSGIGPIERFEADTYEARLAGEVKDVIELDEFESTIAAADPKIRFLLAAADEALENACIENTNKEMLLHLGTGLEMIDLDRVVLNGKVDFESLAKRSLERNASPIKITLDVGAYLFVKRYGRPGRVLTNCSACASGAQAIGNAFRAVRSGLFHTAICGGFDSLIHPLGLGGFQLLGALTTDNARGERACRPFDSNRAGTVLGEGAAIFVLESLERALSEGKEILGEICGYGSTLDAYNLSAPDPQGDGAARAMGLAMEDAGIVPEQVNCISTHGTGTRLNDEVEVAAIRHAFERCWERIPISAIKSMIGHLIGASGPVELAACMLPMLKGILPPNPSLDRVGRGCELDHVMETRYGWDGEYILSNTFGFGGQNAVLVIRKWYG